MRGEDERAEEGGDAVGVPPLDLGGEMNGVGEEKGDGGDDVRAHNEAEAEGEGGAAGELMAEIEKLPERKNDEADESEGGPDYAAGEAGAGRQVGVASDGRTEAVPVEVEAARLLMSGDGEEGIARRDPVAEGGRDEGNTDAPVGGVDAFEEVTVVFDRHGGQQQQRCKSEEQGNEGAGESSAERGEVCSATKERENGDGRGEGEDRGRERCRHPAADDGAEDEGEGKGEEERPKDGLGRGEALVGMRRPAEEEEIAGGEEEWSERENGECTAEKVEGGKAHRR